MLFMSYLAKRPGHTGRMTRWEILNVFGWGLNTCPDVEDHFIRKLLRSLKYDSTS